MLLLIFLFADQSMSVMAITILRDSNGNVYMTNKIQPRVVASESAGSAVADDRIPGGCSKSDSAGEVSLKKGKKNNSPVRKGLKLSSRERELSPLVIEVARELSVSPYLVKAMIRAESDYRAETVSRAGAKGLMQLMDVTAREMNVKDVFDPKENMFGGVGYFKKMLERYNGIIDLALAAYNAGPGNVDRHGGIPPFEETRRYVRKVLDYWRLYRDM
jgi:hypothetical protein